MLKLSVELSRIAGISDYLGEIKVLFVTVILIIVLARVQYLYPIGRLVHFPTTHTQLLLLLVREETLSAGCAVQIAIWSVLEVSTAEIQQLRLFQALRRELGLVI